MANENNNGFMDTIVDAQKQVVNTVLENTKKLTNGNTVVNETIEKGSEWYKNWLENQKNVFGQTAEKATNTAHNLQDNAGKMNEYYQNWMNTQADWAKKMWETTQNHMKNATTPTSTNPMEQMTTNWNNMMNQFTQMQNNTNNMNNWMNQMTQFQNNMNPMNMMNNWKGTTDNFGNIFNQWSEMLNTNFSEFQKNLQGGTIQDAYRNMVNTTEGFTRFTEMWTPMWKSIQEKSFNMEQYKDMMSPAKYKEFMDKFFSFMPESSRNYMQQMTDMMQNGFKQMTGQSANGMHQMREMMSQFMPANTDMFSNMLNAYNNMHTTMANAASPITRMMTPNKYTQQAAEWQDIANRAVVYNIKNAELQYMVYLQGTKVMDALAENITNKMQHGEEVKSMMALYQEWLNISDKNFVALFETTEYSQLMAEVSALQMKLKKDIELQMEKSLVNVPVATRSEMDELYKTIYDLKKEVRQLEKMMEFETTDDTTPAATTEAKTTTTAASKAKKA